MRVLVFLLFLLSFIPVVQSQDSSGSESDLAFSIYRFKTGSRGVMRWNECGSSIRGEAARSRAEEYAHYLWSEYLHDSAFDPWLGAALIAQESSFNRCALSSTAMRALRVYTAEQLGRAPRESDIARVLSSPSYRRRASLPRFDVGLAQFRWPGTAARRSGIQHPTDLLNARTSIRMLASSMRRYRSVCDSVPRYSGVYLINGRNGNTRVHHYNISCSDGYWVQHNSPSRFNYRYYSNVRHKYNLLVGFHRHVNSQSQEAL